jgi:hypothetical protein
MKTERQKYFEEAMKLAELSGCNIEDITIKDVLIPHDLYMQSLKLMTDDNLFSHFKDRIEQEHYEQANIIQMELDRRNIKINYES